MSYRCRWQGVGRNYGYTKSEILESQRNIIALFDFSQSEKNKLVYDICFKGDLVAHTAKLLSGNWIYMKDWDFKERILSTRSDCRDDHFLDKSIVTVYEIMNRVLVIKEKYCANCSHKILNDEFVAIDIDKYIHSECIEEWKDLIKNGEANE